MNQEFKKPWLDALRSGNYEQTKSVLYDGDGYCCLGVLCKVAGSDFVVHKEFVSDDDDEDYHGTIEYVPTAIRGAAPGESENLNNYGCVLFGLSDENLNVLVNMNDGSPPFKEAKSFAEIADWIEENL